MNATPREIAAAGGMIEVGGGIGLTRFDAYGVPLVRFPTTQEPQARWLERRFGGAVDVVRPGSDRRHALYCWRLLGRDAIGFTLNIREHLITKRLFADMLLELRRYRRASTGKRPRLSKSVRAGRQRIAEGFRLLHRTRRKHIPRRPVR